MEYKNEEVFHTILRITMIVAITASIALLITKRDAGPTVAFDLLAYVISFVALILTTLQSISIAQQVRITRHASAKITEALHSIEELVAVDKKLSREVARDAALDEQIIAVLAKHGVGENGEQREKIAKAVARNVDR